MSDDSAELTLDQKWIFAKKEDIEARAALRSAVEEEQLNKAMEQNAPPRLALDCLNKMIAKFDFADESLDPERVRLQAIARAFGMRAWCN
jgi:hypothetical protein